MSKTIVLTIVAVLSIFLVTNANAVIYYDNTIIWDNWTSPVGAQNTQDVVGTGPDVEWIDIIIGPNDVLNSIRVKMDISPLLYGGDRLFIDPDGGDLAWQYFAQTLIGGDGNPILPTKLYSLPLPVFMVKGVNDNKYEISTGRQGHPEEIASVWFGTAYTVNASWDNTNKIWNYPLSDIGIIMSSGWSVGFTEGCANDVILATNGTTPVPEPTTMILLGSGLIGLLGVHRRKMIWQKR